MPDKSHLKITAVGDIMLGDLPACSGFGVGSMIARHGSDFPFAHCRESLRNSDVVCGNLEVVLSRFDPSRDSFAQTHLRAQPEALDGLKACGFNMLSLANNHIMQHGRAAVLETIASLQRAQISYTGIEDPTANIKNLTVREIRGFKIGFLGYNFRPAQYFVDPPIDVQGNEKRVLSDIESYRSWVDMLVLSLHWGEEFVTSPSGEQVRMGRRFVDAGARVILGHHPHIVQGIETYKGGVIAYSLGDFVFDLWQRRLRDSLILHLEISEPADIRYEVEPVLINRAWQPVPLRGAEAEAAHSRITGLSKLVNPDLPVQEFNERVKRELARFRREVYLHYAGSLHKFGVKRFWENLKGVLGRRISSTKQSD